MGKRFYRNIIELMKAGVAGLVEGSKFEVNKTKSTWVR
jgi:hypothetical protein